MSNKISRRAFLKCAGVSAAAVGSASLLSGCKTNGSNTTVNDVKVGDTVKITDGAKRRLAAMGYEPRYGVRSLKRTLTDNVEEPLSSLILDGKLRMGDTVVVESDKARGVRLRVA